MSILNIPSLVQTWRFFISSRTKQGEGRLEGENAKAQRATPSSVHSSKHYDCVRLFILVNKITSTPDRPRFLASGIWRRCKHYRCYFETTTQITIQLSLSLFPFLSLSLSPPPVAVSLRYNWSRFESGENKETVSGTESCSKTLKSVLKAL